jgi:beta-phosphoglucomutase family hydrolase
MKKSIIDAVIFDMDGVITNSTPLHSRAWKEMFDQFLKIQAEEVSGPFKEFTHQDYLTYIDGKPRYLGVKSFLESRSFELPFGDPSQEPGYDTYCALGNLKNQLFNQSLTDQGVAIYPSSIDFIHTLQAAGIAIGLATSSKNATRVLELTGLTDLFQSKVDGIVSAELGLEGKPAPDIFHRACDEIGAAYNRSVVVEDASSGVEAGYRGHFGLVLGVARENNRDELIRHGADLVVEDLEEINLTDLQNWFDSERQRKSWLIEYYSYDPSREGTTETLCAVGNGYFCTRGAMEEIPANPDENYPGTYISGLYNSLDSEVSGRSVSNEDLVNLPNWLPLTFRIGSGDWFDPRDADMLEFHRKLDLKTGQLSRTMTILDREGNQTLVQSERFVSMAEPNLAGIQYKITPINYHGEVRIRSELDGTVTNLGVKRYRELNSVHLRPLDEGGKDHLSYLSVETNQSDIQIGLAAKLQVYLGGEIANPDFQLETLPGKVSTTFEVAVQPGDSICIDKVISIYSSQLPDVNDPLNEARGEIQTCGSFQDVFNRSIIEWEQIWDRIDLEIDGDRQTQRMIRLHLYHSMLSVSPHSSKLDAGIPARGLHGEAYRGHIFWDELYVMPFYDLHFPLSARSALMYRYHRLEAARQAAKQEGLNGAQFPWQSGSDGGEETQSLHLNPISGKWGPDYSHLQRHVSLAIAYNLWNYYWITGDTDFLINFGAELILSICQYWSSLAEQNPQTRRFSISGVMGPDEFHEEYPESQQGGLVNNAYSNLMAVWTLERAFTILKILPQDVKDSLLKSLSIDQSELKKWEGLTRTLEISISNEGILEQFEGYFELEELDWELYRTTYPDIHRLDRILKAEGLSPNSYKVAKQADTLMLFYNLTEDTIRSLITQLGYQPPENLLQKNLDYYLQRTSHGSTLSRLVHAYLAFQVKGYGLSWKLYQQSLRSDFLDIQGGTTREGIHLGVMTGTILFIYRTYAGLNWTGNILKIDPQLPQGWNEITFNFSFRNVRYFLRIQPNQIKIKTNSNVPHQIFLGQRLFIIQPGDWTTLSL